MIQELGRIIAEGVLKKRQKNVKRICGAIVGYVGERSDEKSLPMHLANLDRRDFPLILRSKWYGRVLYAFGISR